ncbi:MAG TPA: TonB family protein, partial [Tepidisphaeraceae bacterium]
AKGFAITSAPGKEAMSARKGNEDQSFASRDPQGPQIFPDEPSMSTVPPGENGDGRKPVRDALEGKGTQSNQPVTLGHPDTPATPPAPHFQPPAFARLDNGTRTPQTNGQSTSRLPAPEKRSPAEPNTPPAQRDDLPNDVAWGQAAQILPIKRPDVISVRSNRQAYPEVVAALTWPPGLSPSPPDVQPLTNPVLPNIVPADIPAASAIQPATAALSVQTVKPEEVALLLGTTDPSIAPTVVEALEHPPGENTIQGGPAALAELVLSDVPSAPAIQDALTPMEVDQPEPQELAQQLQVAPAAETVVASAAPPVSAASESSSAMNSARGGLPGPAVEAADPAPDTGLESDPFAKIPGVEFRNGKVEARSGRKIKPIRPRLTESAQRDLLALQFPTILARVRIDKTGKVTDVTVLHGSGSEAVDMPVYRALWNWWFEPPKDKKGNPLEDVQLVAIHWG